MFITLRALKTNITVYTHTSPTTTFGHIKANANTIQKINKQSHKNCKASTRVRTSHSTNYYNGGKTLNASKMAAIISSRDVKTGIINNTVLKTILV